MKILKKQELVKRIKSAVKKSDDELSDDQVRDFTFHMTDWLEDLEGLMEVYDPSSNLSNSQIYDLLLKFCIHVPLHVVKASEILMDDKFSLLYNDYESVQEIKGSD